jgi:hypothetical protein
LYREQKRKVHHQPYDHQTPSKEGKQMAPMNHTRQQATVNTEVTMETMAHKGIWLQWSVSGWSRERTGVHVLFANLVAEAGKHHDAEQRATVYRNALQPVVQAGQGMVVIELAQRIPDSARRTEVLTIAAQLLTGNDVRLNASQLATVLPDRARREEVVRILAQAYRQAGHATDAQELRAQMSTLAADIAEERQTKKILQDVEQLHDFFCEANTKKSQELLHTISAAAFTLKNGARCERALTAIARVQAIAGDRAGATATVHRIPEQWRRERALTFLSRIRTRTAMVAVAASAPKRQTRATAVGHTVTLAAT